MTDKYYLIALNAIPTLGIHTALALLEQYDYDVERCWSDYANWSKLKLRGTEALIEARRELNAEAVYEVYLRSEANCCSIFDEDYPSLLKEIYDPPLLLFYKGQLPSEKELCIAMVGSRHATAYGRLAGEMLAEGIAAKGISVISGMARGIDAVCHQAAIKKGAKTYAVLGSGIDIIYPRENEKLYNQICEQGAVISEFPCSTPPVPKNFPRRNRIISGMCRGLVVIEAGEKSGTLITVSNALEQNRNVYAVPGPITSLQSKGVNTLLKQGCKPATCAEDIWQDYAEELPKQEQQLAPLQHIALSKEEKRLCELLIMPLQFDAIAQQTGMETGALAAQLTIMEIKGIVKQLPGKFYIRNIPC